VTVRSVWYLVAFDLDRRDWRAFRVDRMADDVERTGHGVSRRTVPGGDPLAFLGASLAEMPAAHSAEITIGTSRDAVLARLPWLNPRRVRELDQGSCGVQLGADDLGELGRQVLDVIGTGPVLALITSPAVRDHLAGMASALASAATTGPPAAG
jgi:predicted DNA-binding transcriptional regulator YafY